MAFIAGAGATNVDLLYQGIERIPDVPEELGKVMTDEDDEQIVDSENKTQNSLEIKSDDGEVTIKAEK